MADIVTLQQLTHIVREFEHELAPGSETRLWADFIEDSIKCYGVNPSDDIEEEVVISHEFASYWIACYGAERVRAEGDDDVDSGS